MPVMLMMANGVAGCGWLEHSNLWHGNMRANQNGKFLSTRLSRKCLSSATAAPVSRHRRLLLTVCLCVCVFGDDVLVAWPGAIKRYCNSYGVARLCVL